MHYSEMTCLFILILDASCCLLNFPRLTYTWNILQPDVMVGACQLFAIFYVLMLGYSTLQHFYPI